MSNWNNKLILNNGQTIDAHPEIMTRYDDVDVDRNSMYENFQYFKNQIDDLKSRIEELEGTKPGGTNELFQEQKKTNEYVTKALKIISNALKELNILADDEVVLLTQDNAGSTFKGYLSSFFR